MEECLADHAWPPGVTTTIVVKSAAPLAAAHPDVLRTFADIVRSLPDQFLQGGPRVAFRADIS